MYTLLGHCDGKSVYNDIPIKGALCIPVTSINGKVIKYVWADESLSKRLEESAKELIDVLKKFECLIGTKKEAECGEKICSFVGECAIRPIRYEDYNHA